MFKKKILIIVGGSKKKIEGFKIKADSLGMNVRCASFSEINYCSYGEDGGKLFVGEEDVAGFDLIYVRMVGKRLEDVSLLGQYAKKYGIRIVDNIYQSELLMPSSIAKSIETKKLIDARVRVPKTIYGSLDFVMRKAGGELGYPYILKSTSGRKARETWLVENQEGEVKTGGELKVKEKMGMRFFAQEFIYASQRVRVFVIGGRVVGAVTRPAKWRKKIKSGLTAKFPDGIKSALNPIPKEYVDCSIKATKAVNLDISGVDILDEDDTSRIFVIEVNAAPAWKLIEKDCGIDVEKEILKYLAKL
jgi:glutathione synthase/RimK-type ligase-like ATP-grasp enzyme